MDSKLEQALDRAAEDVKQGRVHVATRRERPNMDDFNYMQEDALEKWIYRFNATELDVRQAAKYIQDEFLPRFERDIYLNLSSKMLTNANDITRAQNTQPE